MNSGLGREANKFNIFDRSRTFHFHDQEKKFIWSYYTGSFTLHFQKQEPGLFNSKFLTINIWSVYKQHMSRGHFKAKWRLKIKNDTIWITCLIGKSSRWTVFWLTSPGRTKVPLGTDIGIFSLIWSAWSGISATEVSSSTSLVGKREALKSTNEHL